jgi:hypothetical protein
MCVRVFCACISFNGRKGQKGRREGGREGGREGRQGATYLLVCQQQQGITGTTLLKAASELGEFGLEEEVGLAQVGEEVGLNEGGKEGGREGGREGGMS